MTEQSTEAKSLEICEACQGCGHDQWVVYCWVYECNDQVPDGCKLYSDEATND